MPESELAHLRVDMDLCELWACNLPALTVFTSLPWLSGPMGWSGLDWASLPRVMCEHRKLCGRPRHCKELPGLLRQCETWVLEDLAERRRQAGQQQ